MNRNFRKILVLLWALPLCFILQAQSQTQECRQEQSRIEGPQTPADLQLRSRMQPDRQLPTYNGNRYRKQVRPAKNLIVMIPDGTSTGVVSAARWYKMYNSGTIPGNSHAGNIDLGYFDDNGSYSSGSGYSAGNSSNGKGHHSGLGSYHSGLDIRSARLAIDPYLCGTVMTFSSNAPIGDSAPTTSAYMTGMPQQTGNVAVYPAADPRSDLVPVELYREFSAEATRSGIIPAGQYMAYNPLATILEAARIEQDKAVGLVVTVEFPHATPADCSAHHYDRGNYTQIASQMAHQRLDVMFGGGNSYVSEDMKRHFEATGTSYYADDLAAFRAHDSGKVWALWGGGAMPYDIDRDPQQVPSLAEMTMKAIELLSADTDGFFLMVEGSKIDWAAHDNDAVGCITEFLAFDRAVEAALEFARRDGNTIVVILPDHGNSGFTTGRRGLPAYDTATLDELFGTVSRYRRTGEGLAAMLSREQPENLSSMIKEYTGLEITDDELEGLLGAADYKGGGEQERGKRTLAELLRKIMNGRTWFGFTSGGHTGEEVFLAAYHPQGDLPLGLNTNIDINHYLQDAAGLEQRLPELTDEIFMPHTEVFAGLKYSVDGSDPDFPVLTVLGGRNRLELTAHNSVGRLNGRQFDVGSVVVWFDQTGLFYLPRKLAGMVR